MIPFAEAGPTRTISASVPLSLINEVRERVGARGFSQFVSRAMARELARLNREKFLAEAIEHHGPLDAKAVAAARKLLLE
jgi:hypothetical protein